MELVKNSREKEEEDEYMVTTWQEALWWKVQSQVTELSTPFFSFTELQFPSPLHGSFPKSQSLFPNLVPITFSAFTASKEKTNSFLIRSYQLLPPKPTNQSRKKGVSPYLLHSSAGSLAENPGTVKKIKRTEKTMMGSAPIWKI